jgi:hypothetical protein
MLLTKEHTPTLSPSIVFTFGLIVEYIKELGGASTKFALHGTPHPRRKIKPYTTTLPLYTLCTKLIFQI